MILLPNRKLTERDLNRMQIPTRHREARLDRISKVRPSQDELSLQEKILAYGGNLEEMLRRGVGFLLYGPNGVGKSSAAVATMKAACRRGVYGLFLDGARLVEVAIEKPPFDSDMNLWDRAQTVPWLLIDDLGKGAHDEKAFQLRTLDKLIRRRSSHLLVTWVTTNLTPKELSEWLMPSTLAAMQETLMFVSAGGRDLRAHTLDELGGRLFARTG